MILFFPQYQAGYMPSTIPVGTPDLRALWQNAPGFAEVPLQPSDADRPETERGVRFRKVLKAQLMDAMEIVNEMRPETILTTGGDCGASFVPIAYMNEKYKGKIGVLWIDAHADIHTPTTSPSGNYHGMVLRHLMGDVEFDIQPPLPLEHHQVGYLGLRDTEAEEDAVIAHFKSHGITHLYLHVDCDVMDEKVFPHVHVPEPDGLTLERLLEILQYLRSKMPVAGCCLTEYAPEKAGEGLDVIKRVYTEGLGLKLPD